MSKFTTHYDNLQVKENASDEVIKGAYRFLCQKWHPDKNPNNRQEAERILKIINHAFDVLSNPAKRREHDDWIRKNREANRDSGRQGARAEKTHTSDDLSSDKSRSKANHDSFSDDSSRRTRGPQDSTDEERGIQNFSLKLAELIGGKAIAYIVLMCFPYCFALVCVCLLLDWPLASALYVWMPISQKLNVSSADRGWLFVSAGVIFFHHTYVYAELYIDGGFRKYSEDEKIRAEAARRYDHEVKFLKRTYAEHVRKKYNIFHKLNFLAHFLVAAVVFFLVKSQQLDEPWILVIVVIAPATFILGILRVRDVVHKKQMKLLKDNGHI